MKNEPNSTEITTEQTSIAPTVSPIVKIKNLSEKAIIIQLKIGKFSGSKVDTRVSKDVANDEHTSTEYVRVTKSLMKSTQSKNVQNAEQKLRALFYKLTSPWTRDGEGIVKITNYLDVKSKLEELSREYYAAVDELVSNYDNIVKDDKVKLGTMFNASDYPSAESFRSYFYTKIEVKPIEKTDFRSGVLNEAEVEAINNQIEERIKVSIANAQQDNLRRVKEKLSHLFDRLVETDGKFHQSTIKNSLDAIKDAQDLNINDDDGLNKMFEELTNSLSQYNADTIRDNTNIRIAAAETTKEALERINSAMEAFMN